MREYDHKFAEAVAMELRGEALFSTDSRNEQHIQMYASLYQEYAPNWKTTEPAALAQNIAEFMSRIRTSVSHLSDSSWREIFTWSISPEAADDRAFKKFQRIQLAQLEEHARTLRGTEHKPLEFKTTLTSRQQFLQAVLGVAAAISGGPHTTTPDLPGSAEGSALTPLPPIASVPTASIAATLARNPAPPVRDFPRLQEDTPAPTPASGDFVLCASYQREYVCDDGAVFVPPGTVQAYRDANIRLTRLYVTSLELHFTGTGQNSLGWAGGDGGYGIDGHLIVSSETNLNLSLPAKGYGNRLSISHTQGHLNLVLRVYDWQERPMRLDAIISGKNSTAVIDMGGAPGDRIVVADGAQVTFPDLGSFRDTYVEMNPNLLDISEPRLHFMFSEDGAICLASDGTRISAPGFSPAELATFIHLPPNVTMAIDIDTPAPTAEPTEIPSPEPTAEPTAEPTRQPTTVPTGRPTTAPTQQPTAAPTRRPTTAPTQQPTAAPTHGPDLTDGEFAGTLVGSVAGFAALCWMVCCLHNMRARKEAWEERERKNGHFAVYENGVRVAGRLGLRPGEEIEAPADQGEFHDVEMGLINDRDDVPEEVAQPAADILGEPADDDRPATPADDILPLGIPADADAPPAEDDRRAATPPPGYDVEPPPYAFEPGQLDVLPPLYVELPFVDDRRREEDQQVRERPGARISPVSILQSRQNERYVGMS